MKSDELLALAERVKALEGPDREVDGRIAKAAGMNFGFCGDEGWICAACSMGIDTTQFPECGAPLGLHDERTSYPNDWREDERLPRYTASLDAAITLVPEGWGYQIMLLMCVLRNPARNGKDIEVYGKSSALALTAASLRALAHQSTETSKGTDHE